MEKRKRKNDESSGSRSWLAWALILGGALLLLSPASPLVFLAEGFGLVVGGAAGLLGGFIGLVFGFIGTVIGLVFGLVGTVIGLFFGLAFLIVPALLLVAGLLLLARASR